MPQVKRAAKGKRPNKAVSVLGIAGVSLAASTGGSPADIPPASLASPPAGSVADILWQNTAPFQIPFLDEEEISDVSLATFHLFDDLGNIAQCGTIFKRVSDSVGHTSLFDGGGCGCGHGCGGGFRGCGGGFHGCGGGFRGCGAAFEAAALAFEAAEAAALAAAAWRAAAAAAGAGAGAAAAACHGEAAPSARRKRLAITLTEAGRQAGI